MAQPLDSYTIFWKPAMPTLGNGFTLGAIGEKAEGVTEERRQEVLFKTGALQNAILGLHFNDSAETQTLLYVEDSPANHMMVENLIARWPDIRPMAARDAICEKED